MKVTYFGTTMLLFDDGADQLLFDCHITRPSLLRCFMGKFSTDTATADKLINEHDLSRLRAIFISHTHHDHVMDAPYFASKFGAEIIGSVSAVNVALGGGTVPERIRCYADTMSYEIGNFKVKVIPSIHSKAHWYNNDLGQTIDTPLKQPARKKDYKEGGSYDFIIENGGQTYVIRPSYNFIEGQFDSIKADVLFLGIGGLSGDSAEGKRRFYSETVDKLRPSVVIPVHWDNFFTPLYDRDKWCTGALDDPKKSINELKTYCEERGVSFIWQMPLSSLELNEIIT